VSPVQQQGRAGVRILTAEKEEKFVTCSEMAVIKASSSQGPWRIFSRSFLQMTDLLSKVGEKEGLAGQ